MLLYSLGLDSNPIPLIKMGETHTISFKPNGDNILLYSMQEIKYCTFFFLTNLISFVSLKLLIVVFFLYIHKIEIWR